MSNLDVSFEVTKIFPYGSKRPRTLKFSKYIKNNFSFCFKKSISLISLNPRKGIENIRPNGETSSTHPYSSVTRILMKDLSIFIISYEHSHDYSYKSEVAMQIVQELSARAALTRTTEKKKLKYDLALKRRQEVLLIFY